MPDPVLVSTNESGFIDTGSPSIYETVTVSFQEGDLIIVRTFQQGNDQLFGTPGSPDMAELSFTEAVHADVLGKTPLQIYTAIAPMDGTGIDISATNGSAGRYVGMIVTIWRDHGGVGAYTVSVATGTGSVPSWSFTTTVANSAIDAMVGDISHAVGAAGNWTGPSPDTGQYHRGGTVPIASYYGTTYQDAGAAGAKTLGISTPTMNWSSAAIEIIPGVAPVFTVDPVVTGTAKSGQPLTCSSGTAGGAPVPTITYLWQHNDGSGWATVPGATTSTWTPTDSYIGDGARCIVTHTNPNGSDFATSNEVGPIDPADLIFTVQLSGGAANADPALSIGGTESSVEADDELYDDVTFEEATAGFVDYRLVYLKNGDDEDATAAVYVTGQLEAGREIAVGAATEDAGDTVSAIANDETAPAGVTFDAPEIAGEAVDLGTIAAGLSKGVWLRRSVAPGTPVDITNPWELMFVLARL